MEAIILYFLLSIHSENVAYGRRQNLGFMLVFLSFQVQQKSERLAHNITNELMDNNRKVCERYSDYLDWRLNLCYSFVHFF